MPTLILLHSIPSSSLQVRTYPLQSQRFLSRISSLRLGIHSHNNGVKACLFNPTNDPIVKEALREPMAFMGGIFAGLLRLDLNEEPLKEWVTRTVEAAGLTKEDLEAEESATEIAPQQIEIE